MNWHLNGMSIWVLVGAAALTFGLTAMFARKGRKVIVALPATIFVVLVLIVLAIGRNHLGADSAAAKQKAKTDANEAYAKTCGVALDLANDGLYAASREQLAAALQAKPTKVDTTTCDDAVGVLRDANAADGLRVTVNNGGGASSTNKDVDLKKTAQSGTENIAEDIINWAIGGTDNGRTQTIKLGPWGWIVLGLILLLAAAAWARSVAIYVRRHYSSLVKLNDVTDGDDATKDTAAITARLRQHLFEQDLYPPATPVGNLPDDIAGVVEASGVSGGKLIPAVVKVLRRLFGVEEVLAVTVTVSGGGGSPTTPTRRATVQIIEERSGSLRVVKTFQGDPDDVFLQITAFVRTEALRDRTYLEPYEMWTFEALLAFLRAKALEAQAAA